jgi:hypothetical protein
MTLDHRFRDRLYEIDPVVDRNLRRACVRYVTSCSKSALEFAVLLSEQKTDYRDRLATARDALGSMSREAEAVAGVPPRPIWWEQPERHPGWVADNIWANHVVDSRRPPHGWRPR